MVKKMKCGCHSPLIIKGPSSTADTMYCCAEGHWVAVKYEVQDLGFRTIMRYQEEMIKHIEQHRSYISQREAALAQADLDWKELNKIWNNE